MIILDRREVNKTQKANSNLDLEEQFKKLRVSYEVAELPFGDIHFDIKGPDNQTLSVGIERKRLHDMLRSIEDGRYNQQRIGMKEMYDICILLVEGHWRPYAPEGTLLMEGYDNGHAWGYCNPGGRKVMYSTLKRYLISVQMSGVIVDYARDNFQTACQCREWYEWGQKKWEKHQSLLDIHKLPIPQLNGKPTLLMEWAARLPGIGNQKATLAARKFGKPIKMALADETEWLTIPGVGVKTAQQIVREIMGD